MLIHECEGHFLEICAMQEEGGRGGGDSVLHLYIIFLSDECAYVRKIDLGHSFVPSLGFLALGRLRAV